MEERGDNKGLRKCPLCWKGFKLKKHLNQHVRVKHRTEPEIRKTNFRCAGEACDFTCSRHIEMRWHVILKHSCIIEEHIMFFSTAPEFQLWKLQEEKTVGTMFVKHTAGKKVKNDVIKEYYRCHYSSAYSPTAQKRQVLNEESSVIACPATVEAEKMTDGRIQVTYFKTHFGHKVQHNEESILSPEDCKFIAQKLKDGMDINELLYEIKKSSTLSKALTRQDLYRVATKCNLLKLKPREKKAPRLKREKKEQPITPRKILPKVVKSDVISKLKYAALLAECTTTSDKTIASIDHHIKKVIEILQEAHVKTFEADSTDVVTKTLPEPRKGGARKIRAHNYASGQHGSTRPDHSNNTPHLPVLDHSYASDLQNFCSNSVSELFDHSYALDFQELDQNCAPYLSPLPCFDHSYTLDFQEFEHSYACDFDLMKV